MARRPVDLVSPDPLVSTDQHRRPGSRSLGASHLHHAHHNELPAQSPSSLLHRRSPFPTTSPLVVLERLPLLHAAPVTERLPLLRARGLRDRRHATPSAPPAPGATRCGDVMSEAAGVQVLVFAATAGARVMDIEATAWILILCAGSGRVGSLGLDLDPLFFFLSRSGSRYYLES